MAYDKLELDQLAPACGLQGLVSYFSPSLHEPTDDRADRGWRTPRWERTIQYEIARKLARPLVLRVRLARNSQKTPHRHMYSPWVLGEGYGQGKDFGPSYNRRWPGV